MLLKIFQNSQKNTCVEFVLNLCWICVEFVLDLCWVQFFNKVAGLMNVTLLERTLRQKYFSLNFAKFWKTSFLQNTSGRLLLNHDNTNGQLKTSKSCYLWKPNYWVEILENIVNFLQQSWGDCHLVNVKNGFYSNALHFSCKIELKLLLFMNYVPN